MKKELFDQLKQMYPTASTILFSYYGSGDSFDSFHSCDAKDKDGNEVKIDEQTVTTLSDDFLWHCLDNTDGVGFNDDGCEGTIEFALDQYVATIDNYYFETITNHSGTNHF